MKHALQHRGGHRQTEPLHRFRLCAVGCTLVIEVADDAEAKRVFTALGQGGNVTMPLMKTFWASSFGMLTDKFGVPWMVNVAATSA